MNGKRIPMTGRKRQPQKAEVARGGVLRLVVVGLVNTALVGVALTGWRQSQAAKVLSNAPFASGFASLSKLPVVTLDQRPWAGDHRF